MLSLSPQHVFMQQHASSKAEALQLLCDILVKEGLTTPAYLQGLQDREAQHATYLGQGIAIPHGTPASRDAIIETGVRLVHFPQGVQWDEDNHLVYLAAVIAAKSDEHLQVLQLLTRALSDNVSDAIKNATTPEQILDVLNATPPSLNLHENLIVSQFSTDDIDEVIYQAGQLFKQHNLVSQGFISSLQIKDAILLNDNIWCITSTQNVKTPAVSLVNLTQPLTFEHNHQQQHLNALVCIAENQNIDKVQLASLLDKLLQPNALPSSFNTHELAQVLGAEVIPDWSRQSVVLANAHGLHARPATALVKVCQTYQGDIRVAVDNSDFVSAKSLTKLLSLGATYGQTLHFIAEPNTDAEAGLSSVIDAVKAGLGEEVKPIENATATSALTTSSSENTNVATLPTFDSFAEPITHLNDDQAYKGIIASSGLAVAKAHVVKKQHFEFAEFATDKQQEHAQLHQAITQVKEELAQTINQSTEKNIQEIFTAHLAMLDDAELVQPVDQAIEQGLSAPMAWSRHIEATATAQEQLGNQLLAERAADLRDIGNKVLAKLCGVEQQSAPNEPYILIMQDIVPSDVAKLDKNKVAGILTAVGGASSHSAIVARALGIPTLVGASEAILQIQEDSQVLVDANNGSFYVNPNAERVEQTLTAQAQMQALQSTAREHCQQPAITQDNHRVEVAVNIGNVHDTAKAVEAGAEAVGLLRTELVFMSHDTAPNEATQQQDYQVVLDALDGRPLVVRTLDVGGDKPLPYLPLPHEENPFLGLRGIRLTLRRQDLLKEQLTALIKSANGRPLRIMFPMIGRLEDWRAAKAILDEILTQYPCPNLQVGIMVEVPSIAILAPILAKEVDFFSIGTNDLTQYTLAIDRGHPLLSSEADGLHPSILMLINRTVHAAHANGKWVGVCGELASDPKAAPILIGLGVDELSVSATSIPMLKAQIRTLNFEACKKLADEAMNCATAEQVRQLVK